jgi:hypothetical protein
VNPVPSSRNWSPTVGERSPSGALRATQEKPKVAAGDIGKGWQRTREKPEVKVRSIECYRGFDIIDYVPNIHGGHCAFSLCAFSRFIAGDAGVFKFVCSIRAHMLMMYGQLVVLATR